ncbi:MAG TPA: LUD domain-containing protein, partial [Rhodospirillales bacterium]|nr:LUD domain-containing protein [Rhodospirillales bacterium]
MTDARTQMLAAVRAALGRDRLPAATEDALDHRLREARANVVPARGRPAAEERIDRFVFEAERVNATVVRLAALEQVPSAVVSYLRAANMPAAARIGVDALMRAIPWSAEPLLETATGAAVDTDTASVTSAFTGIAETGTMMLLSGPESPTTLNFLPEAHLVVLPAERIVGSYEDAW